MGALQSSASCERCGVAMPCAAPAQLHMKLPCFRRKDKNGTRSSHAPGTVTAIDEKTEGGRRVGRQHSAVVGLPFEGPLVTLLLSEDNKRVGLFLRCFAHSEGRGRRT